MKRLNKETNAYKNKLKYIGGYNKEFIKTVPLQFHKIKDTKVLDKLDSVPSKTDYVRQLILKDIRNED